MEENGAAAISVPITPSQVSGQGQGRNSIPLSENAVWADVSSLLEAACQDLQHGELIHGDNFNLFAAMSALEIMDPKMDSGMIGKYCSLDEAIEKGAAPIPVSYDKTVDVRCTVDIMDHLLACEATWHKGHSLAQTLFSCLYLLHPERTSNHTLLDSYLKVIRATSYAILLVASDARTHEEEDIFTLVYGLPLVVQGDDKCLSVLNAVEETILRQLRACKASSTKRRVLEVADVEPLQSNLDLEEDYCKALLCRLHFRKHFYHLLTCMRRPQGRGLELARKHIASCLSELNGIQKSSEFLRASASETFDNTVKAITTASGCPPIGFDASLNCRIVAPAPPRAVKILSWEKAIEYFIKLIHDLDIICAHSLDQSWEGVLHFVLKFQKSQPDLVARALLQTLLVQEGKFYGRDSFFSIITRSAGLPEVIKNHDIQKSEPLTQLAQLVINLLKILCTNSSWQRRKLGKMLQDWRVIYLQVELAFKKEFGEGVMNASTNENVCFRIFQQILIWVEEQTYWIALRFLFLGFELELYTLHEYCMIYWYIHIVLIKLAEKTHMKMATRSGNAKQKGKKKRESTKDAAKDFHIPPAVLFLQCQIYLAEGLSMMLAALQNEGRILPTPCPFNTEHEIFIQHFDLLLKACVPEHISFLSFKESIVHARLSTLVMYNYFKETQRIAKEIKRSFSNDPDKMAEIRRIEQVAEHNSIALNVIHRVGATDPQLKVAFDFSHHPYYATATVKR